MNNDTDDKTYTWPERFRQYDVVENRRSTKEENWEKLRARLEQTPVKKLKTFPWYKVAAAAVLVVFALRPTAVTDSTKTTGSELVTAGRDKAGTGTSTSPSTSAWVDTTAPQLPIAKQLLPSAPGKDSALFSPGYKSVKNELVNQDGFIASDTQLAQQDIAREPGEFPEVHLTDIDVPGGTSLEKLGVKKMIRLFGTDMTIQHPDQVPLNIPTPLNSIPKNQN